jgi:tetratricopeptide (TPR) repeat protein
MKRVFVILIVVLLGNSVQAFADIAELNWQNANKFYQQKQYDSAVVYYEKIATLKSSNSALYYNLGNAYYRLNKIGNAVLNYERALFYDPSNQAAKDNLLLAQNRISNRVQVTRDIFFVRWWKYVTQGNHATFWGILSLFLFGGLLALLVLKRLGKMPERVPVQVYFIGALVLVMTLFWAFIAADNYSDTNLGVIMFNNTPFNSAASPQSKAPLALLQEGTVVSIEQQQNSSLNITLPDGRNGWIQQSAITYVQPQRK